MSANANIRIGFVGAGANTRLRHIPGFQAIDGVEVVAVANRSAASGQRVADEFGIPRVFDNWQDLVNSPEVDAVCIGTWPYMHCTVTLAALGAGMHVLTEARMAMDAAEAKAMLQASRSHPGLVTQVVPSPFTFKVDRTVQDLVASGYLGDLIAIEARVTQGGFPDFRGPLHWRQDRVVSGYNILTMGIWYEALMRWVGPATEVYAMTRVVVPQRFSEDGQMTPITVPDHVDVLCTIGGAQAHLAFSAVTGLGAAGEVWLFGTEGTIHLDARTMTLSGGKPGDRALTEIVIDPQKEDSWRVEEEFINAIRGLEPVTRTSFQDGVAYMEFTEAVTRSAQAKRPVALPL